LIKADADLIAAGLLLDLKTDSKLSLGVTTMFQVIGYALLDFDDTYRLAELGIFSARYAHLATWDIGILLDELAGHHVSLPFIRQEFRELLLAHQLSVNARYCKPFDRCRNRIDQTRTHGASSPRFWCRGALLEFATVGLSGRRRRPGSSVG
jgi:hypothetical protein